MLVLSRRVNQSIRIGPDIVITVTKVAGGCVQIGIDAPRALNIRREELPELVSPRVLTPSRKGL